MACRQRESCASGNDWHGRSVGVRRHWRQLLERVPHTCTFPSDTRLQNRLIALLALENAKVNRKDPTMCRLIKVARGDCRKVAWGWYAKLCQVFLSPIKS